MKLLILIGLLFSNIALAKTPYNACIVRSYQWVRTNYAISHCDGKIVSRLEKPDSEASVPTLMTQALDELIARGMELQDCDLSTVENEKYVCLLTGKKQ